jgi:hypothetical protein
VFLQTTLSPLRDHILDRNVKVGERAKEHRPHLLEYLRARRIKRHWRVEQHVRLDDLVDRLRGDPASPVFMASWSG